MSEKEQKLITFSQVTNGRLIQVDAKDKEEAEKLIAEKIKEFELQNTKSEPKILKTPTK